MDSSASTVHAGLPYTTIIETMPIVFTSQEGSTASMRKQCAQLDINMYESLGTKFGIEGDTNEVFSSSDTTLVSDWKKLAFMHGFDDDITIYIDQDDPLPLTLRALIPKISIEER